MAVSWWKQNIIWKTFNNHFVHDNINKYIYYLYYVNVIYVWLSGLIILRRKRHICSQSICSPSDEKLPFAPTKFSLNFYEFALDKFQIEMEMEKRTTSGNWMNSFHSPFFIDNLVAILLVQNEPLWWKIKKKSFLGSHALHFGSAFFFREFSLLFFHLWEFPWKSKISQLNFIKLVPSRSSSFDEYVNNCSSDMGKCVIITIFSRINESYVHRVNFNSKLLLETPKLENSLPCVWICSVSICFSSNKIIFF